MTYQREHLVPILWSGSFQTGTNGSYTVTAAHYIQLVLPTDAKENDVLRIYYSGYSVADGQAIGFHFAKMSIAAADTAVDNLASGNVTDFDSVTTVAGDTGLDQYAAKAVTGAASLTLTSEIATYVQAGKPIALAHYNSTSTSYSYVFDWTILLERM